MIAINKALHLNENEIKVTFIASPGPGGQNVNKVATGVQLRFNVWQCSLPEEVRLRLVKLVANKLTREGDIIIKATRFRTQVRNKLDAVERLCDLIRKVAVPAKKRKKTKPTLASKKKRLDSKKIQAKKKLLRRGDLS